MLTRDQAGQATSRLGCRLPLEAEYEYSLRAGTTTLFVWGDQVPGDREVEKWLRWEFPVRGRFPRNAYGLGGFFFCEWCADEWRPTLDPAAVPVDGEHVLRGGGAHFYPWQDAGEWVFCMSSIRMETSWKAADPTAAARPVLSCATSSP